MRTLIITESWFGNTHAIGRRVARGLEAGGASIESHSVADAPDAIPEGTDLLVIGAPTHNRNLSTPATRSQAASRLNSGAQPSANGVREWISQVSIPEGTHIAIFDTVTGKNWLSGSAAKAAAKILSKRFRGSSIDVTSFVVTGTEGPLAEGEEEAAQAWGEGLARF